MVTPLGLNRIISESIRLIPINKELIYPEIILSEPNKILTIVELIKNPTKGTIKTINAISSIKNPPRKLNFSYDFICHMLSTFGYQNSKHREFRPA